MPDWIIHLSASSLAGAGKGRFDVDYRLAVTGSLLPDSMVPLYVLLVDVFNISAWPGAVAVSGLHSISILVLLTASISLFTLKPLVSWFILLSFSLLHVLLDSLVHLEGNFLIPGFPFSMENFQLTVFNAEAALMNWLPLVFLPLVIYLAVRQSPYPIWSFPGKKKGLLLFVLVLLISSAYYSGWNKFYESDYHHIKLFYGEEYNGRQVTFPVSEITSIEPLQAVEMGKVFDLNSTGVELPDLKEGDKVNFSGIYAAPGTVQLDHLEVSRALKGKILYSLAGLLLASVIILKGSLSAILRRRQNA